MPASLLALEAGKHVYVEKPCTHNLREGRLFVEAARRTKRIVQVGTQSRSADYVRRAMELLHNGAIDEVLVAKAWNSQLRANIGHVRPSDPPAQLDQFIGNSEADKLLRRTYREGHWATPKDGAIPDV